MLSFSAVSLALLSLQGVSCYPFPIRLRDTGFAHQNGLDAQSLNQKFSTLTTDSQCSQGEDACVNSQFAQCVSGKFVLQSCGTGLVCAALPLVNSAGTSITCTTASDRDQRIQTALNSGGSGTQSSLGSEATSTDDGNTATTMSASSSAPSASSGDTNSGTGNSTGGGDLQSSTTLDPSVIAQGFAQNGLNESGAEPGQVASQTSTNNFINYCATTNLPITNGQQIQTGSCNPAPMGVIASTKNMPAAKFVKPANLDTIKANTNFDIVMAIKNLDAGNFVNAKSNYYSAPQQVNEQGDIRGHSHFVIEELQSLNQTEPLDNTKFAFFQGVNSPVNSQGQLTVTVNKGLPKGYYRLASINSAANHQPVLVAVAQHGSLDDMVYFTVE